MTLIAVIHGSLLLAQPAWTTFTGEDLNSQVINTWLADKSGNLWLGTAGGISVYTDGQWIPLSRISDASQKNTESIGNVLQLWEDRQGNMWVVSTGKLFINNGEMWILVNDKDYAGYTVKFLLNDSRDEIWLCSEFQEVNKYAGVQSKQHLYGTVVRYNGMNWVNYGRDIGDEIYVQTGYPEEFYTGILEDRHGYIWIGSATGLQIFALTRWITIKDETLPNQYVTGLIQDSKFNIWISTIGGIARFDGAAWQVFKRGDGLGGNYVRQVCEDLRGNIWAFIYKGMSLQGLSICRDNNWTYFESGKGIPSGNIISDVEDFKRSGFLLTRSGFACFDGDVWFIPGPGEGLEGDRYYKMVTDSSGNAWIASDKGLFRGNGKSFTKVFTPAAGTWTVTALLCDSQGRIWTATEVREVYLTTSGKTDSFGLSDGLPDEEARELVEDNSGRIWVICRKAVALLGAEF